MSAPFNHNLPSVSASEGASTPVDFIRHGLSLMDQFENSGMLEHLDDAIAYQNQAIELATEGDAARSWALSCLGEAFMRRFNHYGNPEDIIKATESSTRAVDTAPESLMGPFLGILGKIYLCRFSAFHQLEDIERSLSSLAQALCHDSPTAEDLPETYSELGLALQCRFEQLKQLKDIDHAVMCHEQSLIFRARLPQALPKWLGSLGTALRDRFEYLDREQGVDQVEDINRSIDFLRRAVRLTPDSRTADKAVCSNNFATALACRFEHRGSLADLDESIQNYEQALSLTPDGHSNKAGYLNNLGHSLRARFDRLGDVNDINQAISHQERSISLSSMNKTPYPGFYSNLGNSLLDRFNCLKDSQDLNEAIRHMKKAVQITVPSDVFRSRWLSDLGNSLRQRFWVEGNTEDIDASIDCLKEAISATLDSDAYRARWFTNLGNSFMSRFLGFNQIDDLENAVKYHGRASSLIPEGHILKCKTLDFLGGCHMQRFLHSHIILDLILGIWYFHEAALLPSGEPHHRLNAALKCARYSLPMDKVFALKHYEMAMDLFPSVVWLGTTIRRRYEGIFSIGSIVSEAAAAAIAFKEHIQALEWLEQGRSIVWQQILSLRTPFDELSEANPALGGRLKVIAHQLNHISSPQATSSGVLSDAPVSEQNAQKHRRLAEAWEQALEEVRLIPGFDGFMRPRKAAELVQAGRSGAVVIFNIYDTRCDALALCSDSDDIIHIPLPKFSHQKAATAYENLVHMLEQQNPRQRGTQTEQVDHAAQTDQFEIMLSLLWSDIVQPVLEVLGYTQTTLADELPHITWCTTGPLAFLPLHAASCQSKPESRVYSYAISSYTPTISALLVPSRNTHDFKGILAVGQTNTPGFNPLPATALELSRIKEQARGVRFTQLDGENATTEAVLDEIEKHSWVHLACHGSQGSFDPTASAFHLHNGPLSLVTIMQKSFKHADLAFLSACETAKGDERLPNEAVHLAAGMLMAGFPSVIATMWSIRDEDAPLVAQEVYARLLEGGIADSRRAAKALHMAVERLREEVGEKAFTLWVPYIHLGI